MGYLADTLPESIATADDVARWFAAMAPYGGVPHPDDRAYDVNEPDRSGIIGPLFRGSSAMERAEYDMHMDDAYDVCSAAGVDIYELAMAASGLRALPLGGYEETGDDGLVAMRAIIAAVGR